MSLLAKFVVLVGWFCISGGMCFAAPEEFQFGFCTFSPKVESLRNVKRAREFAAANKYNEAVKVLESYLRKHPRDLENLVYLGLLNNDRGDYAQSREHLTKALSYSNGGKDIAVIQQVYIVRAFANSKLKNKAEAYADIEKATSINAKNVEVYHIRGLIDQTFGNYKSAMINLERGLQPGSDGSYLALSRCADKLKLYDKQEQWLDKLCREFPTRDYLNERRGFYAKHGKMSLAVRDALECLKLKPYEREMHDFTISALCQLNDYDGAADAVARAIVCFPKDREFKRLRARIQLLKGEVNGAVVELKKLLKAHPDDPDLIERLAIALRKQCRYEESIVEFQKASRIREPNDEVRGERAECYRLAEQYSLAALDYKVLYQHTLSRTFILQAGQAWLSMGEYKKALDTFALAIDDKGVGHPLNDKAKISLYASQALANLRLDHYEQAVAAASKAIALNPHHLMSHFYRGQANAKLGKLDAAIADMTETIKIRPDVAIAYDERAKLYDRKKQFDLARRDRLRMSVLSKKLESDVFPEVPAVRNKSAKN
jgi:tetratricopeptide (TPR) repeat protein